MFRGGIEEYRSERAAARERWARRFAEQEQELARLEGQIASIALPLHSTRTIRDNNTLAYNARGEKVQSQISRRIQNVRRRTEQLERSRIAAPRPELHISAMPRGPRSRESTLLTVNGAAIAGRSAPVSFTIEPGQRVLLSGPNGVGKSTVLALLEGSLTPDRGSIERAAGLRIASLPQRVPAPDDRRTAGQYYAALLGAERAQQSPLAESGLLTAAACEQPMSQLSAGMRRRVPLAALLADPPELLLLDEPSNHLSILLVEELRAALAEFTGAVVIASHDRWWQQNWGGQIVELVRPDQAEHAVVRE